MRICVFGDSITHGHNDIVGGGWCDRLKQYYFASKKDVSVYNLGVSGDNSNDLEERFKTEAKARKPDVVLFSIGTNDSQYIKHTKNPRVSITQFKKNLVRIIKETRECNIEKVMFIELIPVVENKVMPIPWSPSKFYDNQNIKKYNQIIEEVAEENDVPFCPMFDLLK